jgi:hypothetical protein
LESENILQLYNFFITNLPKFEKNTKTDRFIWLVILSPIEISGKSVRLPLYCAGGTYIALVHSGKTDYCVALSGILNRLGYN